MGIKDSNLINEALYVGNKMYCRNCGKELGDTAAFCINCGTQVREKKDDSSIEDIVLRLQAGTQQAFDELYLMTQQYVRYFATQFFQNDSSRVEDVVQEVYITIYRKIDTLKDPSATWGWIKTITRNTALNMLEKEGKYVLIQEDEEYVFENIEETDTFALPENVVDEKETRELLSGMIEELPFLQRIILLEHYYNNKKISEISEAYDLVESTVKVYLSRARKALAEKVTVYQRRTGVQLYSVSATPLFYMVFRNEIQSTVATSGVPKAIARALGAVGISKTAVTGVKAAEELGKNVAVETATKAAGTAKKTVAVKVVAGVTVTAVVGTGAVQLARNYADDEKAIIQVVESFEDACQELDNTAALNCLTDKSKQALKHTDLMKEYINTGQNEISIKQETDIDLQVRSVQVEGDEARAYCFYVSFDEGENEDVEKGYLGFLYEDGKWKIELCRSSRKMFQEGTQGKNTRFPELIQNELTYNDELDK